MENNLNNNHIRHSNIHIQGALRSPNIYDLVKRTINLLDAIYQPREITLEDGTTMATMPTSDRQRIKRINQLKHTPTKK